MAKPIDDERRLVAIFAADVEGYSRLMGADEVSTLRDLTQRRAVLDGLIASHRGRIANTAGDSVLAEFGSAVDAVRCAVEAQEALAAANAGASPDRHINFRIGVYVGDVMVKGGDLFGDGVNIAARLQTLASAGGTCISGVAHDQVRKILPFVFTDLGAQHVKNIEEPVRAFAVRARGASAVAVSSNASMPLALPDKLSIAVLPFANMSSDPEQEYLADGMTEDTITLLSQTRDFVVIARNSMLAYKGQPVDIADVGRQLRVRYVLEGSVRKAGNRIRVTAQLVEVRTLNRVWADHFDSDLTDLFALQDDITSGIVGAVHPQLISAEAQSYQRQPPSSLDAWGLVARSMMALVSLTKENLDTAVDLATQAVEIAPDYGLAYGIKAFAQGFQSYTQWGQDWYEDAKQASNNIKRALALQGDDPTTLFLVGGASHFMARHRTGVALLERAVQLNPNLAMAHGLLGLSYASIDRPAEGLSHVETALRLSPRDPMTYLFFLSQALCKFVSGDYSGALSSAERSASIHPGSDCHLYMAAALAELAELDKAREQIKRALAFSPKMNLVVIGRGVQGNPGWEKYHAALRKAGLPE